MTQKTFNFPLGGGLDLTTPPAAIHPGRVLSANNYEPDDEGGYRRILGYERFDGQPSPSAASYWFIYYDQGSGTEPVAGNIVTGLTSTDTAQVLFVVTNTGTWGVDAAGWIVVVNATGLYSNNETLQVAAATIAVADGALLLAGIAAEEQPATTDALHETYLRAAREARRALIAAVPGAGPIRGVWFFNSFVYAVRDNVGQTLGVMHKSSAAGFTVVPLGNYIDFDKGSIDPFEEGETVTGSPSTATGVVVSTGITIGSFSLSNTDYVLFDTGAIASFAVGETVTASPSGATGVVASLIIDSGAFGTGDEAGELHLHSVTGVFTASDTLLGGTSGATANCNSALIVVNMASGRLYLKTISGTFTASDTLLGGTSGAVANCNSASTAVTLPPGGKYQFYNYNFGGSIGTYSMWGVNGVGRGFRYDGTDFSPIHVTGLTDATDKPQHVVAHKKHLFFSIGSSVQHSSTGFPMVWSALSGAAEIATGDTCTGMQDQPGGTLAIFNRNRTYILYGNDVGDWDLSDYNLEKGAIEWTIQDAGVSIYFDDRGISVLDQTDKWGDFDLASISQRVDPLIQFKKRLVNNSVRIRSKSQYRVFFSDGTGLILRVDNHPQRSNQLRYEFMPMQYDAVIESICSEEDLAGFEHTFFGDSAGFIFEAEKGESFDGALIKFFLRLPFCHCASPRQQKAFRKATFQVDSPDQIDINFSPEFSYGRQPGTVTLPEADFSTSGAEWDAGSLWGSFIWDGQLVGEAEAYIQGEGINASLQIIGESNFEQVHVWQSCTYNYSMRGLRR